MVSQTETSTTEIKVTKEKVLPPFIALIFTPGKIRKAADPFVSTSDLTGITTRDLMRCGQHFGVLPENYQNIEDSLAISMQTFFIHPGTNIGVHRMGVDEIETITRLETKLWLRVCENPINRSYLFYSDPLMPNENTGELTDHRHEAIEVLIPVKPDNFGEPGYRNFSDLDAIKLVTSTMHERWIDRYLAGEKRPNVLTVAERQKAKIIQIKKVRENGG